MRVPQQDPGAAASPSPPARSMPTPCAAVMHTPSSPKTRPSASRGTPLCTRLCNPDERTDAGQAAQGEQDQVHPDRGGDGGQRRHRRPEPGDTGQAKHRQPARRGTGADRGQHETAGQRADRHRSASPTSAGDPPSACRTNTTLSTRISPCPTASSDATAIVAPTAREVPTTRTPSSHARSGPGCGLDRSGRAAARNLRRQQRNHGQERHRVGEHHPAQPCPAPHRRARHPPVAPPHRPRPAPHSPAPTAPGTPGSAAARHGPGCPPCPGPPSPRTRCPGHPAHAPKQAAAPPPHSPH